MSGDQVVLLSDVLNVINSEPWLCDSVKVQIERILQELLKMPEDDLVPVVLRKGCEHRHSNEFCECRPEDGYCNDGERRADDATN